VFPATGSLQSTGGSEGVSVFSPIRLRGVPSGGAAFIAHEERTLPSDFPKTEKHKNGHVAGSYKHAG